MDNKNSLDDSPLIHNNSNSEIQPTDSQNNLQNKTVPKESSQNNIPYESPETILEKTSNNDKSSNNDKTSVINPILNKPLTDNSSDKQSNRKINDSINERCLNQLLNDKELGTDKQEYLAKIHCESLIINGKYQQCDCCNYKIPKSSFGAFEKNPSLSYYKYGIDCVNYFLFLNFYIKLMWMTYVTYLIEFFIGLIRRKFYIRQFDIVYIEYFFQDVLYNEDKGLKFLYVFVRIIITLILIIKLGSKMKLSYKDYRKNLSKYYIDESIYSIFLKNIPVLTEVEEFREHIEKEHPVKIKKMIFLRESEKYIELKKEINQLHLQKELLPKNSIEEKYNKNWIITKK